MFICEESVVDKSVDLKSHLYVSKTKFAQIIMCDFDQ